jgi:hypothetical protein
MKHFPSKHYRCARLITFLISFFILFWGIRVPDFSREQKPQPMRRAMLENKITQNLHISIVKIHLEAATFHQSTSESPASCKNSPEPQPITSIMSFLPIDQLPSRASPV